MRYAHSGVRQGSVLRPILYLVCIGDFTNELENPHFLFRDQLELAGESRTRGCTIN